MAYNRRRTYRRRYRRPPLSDRQERAVKAIALGTAETKHFVFIQDVSTLLVDPVYYNPTTPWATWVGNIIAPIPRIIDDVITPDNENVAGDEMNFRGWKFWIDFQYINATPTTPVYTGQYRFTVYRTNSYSGGAVSSTSGAGLYDPDFPFVSPTQWVWDTNLVDIVYQRKWTVGTGGGPSQLIDKTFWIPMNRKLVMKQEMDAGTSTTNELLGWQYYYCMEIRIPGQVALQNAIGGQIAWKAYWKDP